ncbi:MAG TPA: NAD(P)-dependent oxidoreductase [Burkholderiaceae bacterium]|nr:NAD(P)-dependent oxidoreductase [Burkholderiaceae bacterium]
MAARSSRVLVTGATGFLGSHVSRRLEGEGCDTLCISRRPPQRPDGAAHVLWVQCDLLDRAQIDAVIGRIQPARVFHLAGSSRDRGLAGAASAFDANVVATANLLLAVARHCPDARVVTAGTLECSNPWTDVPQFHTAYGAAKVAAEMIARHLREHHALDVVSARIGMTYGPADPNDTRLVPYVIRSLLQRTPPRLSHCNRREDWIYIDDVVDALLRIGGAPAPLPPTLDVGHGRAVTARDVVETICDCLGTDVAPVYGVLPDRPGDAFAADIADTTSLLDWRPQVELRDGIARTVRWHLQQAAALSKAAAN